jgi:DNA-directed RNA polymerase subunit RPC12/RpoP
LPLAKHGDAMNDKVTVSFTCERCGEKLSWSGDAIDSTEISCKKCGKHFGTYADLRRTALKTTKAKFDSILKDVFKRR